MSDISAAAATAQDDRVTRLWDDLTAQVVAVDRRVRAAGSYAHESGDVRRAALEVCVLQRQLGLGRYIGSLTPATGKPQYLLEFEVGTAALTSQPRRDRVVLKVYGRSRPGEAALQQHWHRRGLPTPPVQAFADSPLSWILMQRVLGTTVAAPSSRDDALVLTREVAEIMARVHAEGDVGIIGARSLTEGVMQHLEAVVAALLRHGYGVPPDWAARALSVYKAGHPVSLHGDLFPGNLLRASDMRLLLMDSCAYLGDASFDAARWAVRLATPACPPDALLATWLRVEDLDPALANAMLGVECLMQAGVREIVKDERGEPAGDRDTLTMALLTAYRRSRELS